MSPAAEKLTDRIIAWMIEVEPQGKPQHFARDVAKEMGCSVGSAAQGLYLLFCHGFVSMIHVRNSANVYWLTAKGRAASNDWRPMGTAPRNRFIELRGRIDTTRPKEQVYKACFNHHFGCYTTPKGNQVAATAWREAAP